MFISYHFSYQNKTYLSSWSHQFQSVQSQPVQVHNKMSMHHQYIFNSKDFICKKNDVKNKQIKTMLFKTISSYSLMMPWNGFINILLTNTYLLLKSLISLMPTFRFLHGYIRFAISTWTSMCIVQQTANAKLLLVTLLNSNKNPDNQPPNK